MKSGTTDKKKPSNAPPKASGGGGEDLPKFDWNTRAGRSRISGTSSVLPSVAVAKHRKNENEGTEVDEPLFPPGKGPALEQLHAKTETTAQTTGSLPTTPTKKTKTTDHDPKQVNPIMSNTGKVNSAQNKTAWVASPEEEGVRAAFAMPQKEN